MTSIPTSLPPDSSDEYQSLVRDIVWATYAARQDRQPTREDSSRSSAPALTMMHHLAIAFATGLEKDKAARVVATTMATVVEGGSTKCEMILVAQNTSRWEQEQPVQFRLQLLGTSDLSGEQILDEWYTRPPKAYFDDLVKILIDSQTVRLRADLLSKFTVNRAYRKISDRMSVIRKIWKQKQPIDVLERLSEDKLELNFPLLIKVKQNSILVTILALANIPTPATTSGTLLYEIRRKDIKPWLDVFTSQYRQLEKIFQRLDDRRTSEGGDEFRPSERDIGKIVFLLIQMSAYLNECDFLDQLLEDENLASELDHCSPLGLVESIRASTPSL
ncbi:hypothetical protein DENSPDRAFT_661757 [Dentipellis sp. KUC8613]|nr:hypothetical protein DENSPDRAFT_661757 [Dentipellis sp. KUC8613]